ncbi:MAG: hypothetical protein KKB31_01725 [Nanoarchaeota archaeon]|nr:hypothetical protein [Nanoarchaeota archaeon]
MSESKLKKLVDILTPVKGDRIIIDFIERVGEKNNIPRRDINMSIVSAMVSKYGTYSGVLYYGTKYLLN